MIKGAAGRHRHLSSNITLTQEDFDDIQQRSDERQTKATKMLASLMSGGLTRREQRNAGSMSEKPLPAPPMDRTMSEAPLHETQTSSTLSSRQQQPSTSERTTFQRSKRKVVWKGKTCTIALPLDDVKDEQGRPKILLKPDEIVERLAQWERSGTSTRGFDLTESYPGDLLSGQSCDIYPETSIHQDLPKSNKIVVRIPNKQLWNDYVKELQEQKLRALGVTLLDDEPPTRTSSVLSQNTRQSSLHSPYPQALLAQTLPGPPLSINGFRSPMDQMISPPGSAPTSQFPFPQAMISPSIQPVVPRSAGFHMTNHSVAFNRDRAFSSNTSSSQASFMPGQQYLGSTPTSRGISPLVDDGKEFNRPIQSPLSPMPEMLRNGFVQGQLNYAINAHQQGRFSTNFESASPISLQRQMTGNLHQQTPTQYVSQPEIASPLPQGRSHRHNVSESLQREIDEAEKDLESSVGQQPQHADTTGHGNIGSRSNTSSVLNITAAINPGPPPKKSMSIVSDIETNPSQTSSPVLSPSKLRPKVDHGKKQSVSRLNVNAQEFVFNPGKSSLAAPMFTFEDKPPVMPQTATSTSFEGSHPNKTSIGSSLSAGLNVAAPAFVPRNLTEGPFSRNLSFSSKSPGLKPDAPAFTPGFVFNGSGDGGANEISKVASLFGFDTMQQVNKKTKAIPIVPPEADDDAQEDEEGRITRGEGRLKRTRRGGGSGDQVPLFAPPPNDVSTEVAVLPKPDMESIKTEQEPVAMTETHSESLPAPETKSVEPDGPKVEDSHSMKDESKQMADQVVPADAKKIDTALVLKESLPEDTVEIAGSANRKATESVEPDLLETLATSTTDATGVEIQPILNDKNIDHIDNTTDNLRNVRHHNQEEGLESSSTEIANAKSKGLANQSSLPQISISPVHEVDPSLNTADFLATPAKLDSPLDNKVKELEFVSRNGNLDLIDAVKSDGTAGNSGNLEDPFIVGDHEGDNHTDKSIAERQISPPELEMVRKVEAIEQPNGDWMYDAAGTQKTTLMENKPTNLSAKAKPFVFNPSVSIFSPEPAVQSFEAPEKLVEAHISELKTPALKPLLKSQSDIPLPEHAPSHPSIDLASIASRQVAPNKPAFSMGMGASRYATEEPSSTWKKPSPISNTSLPDLPIEQAPIKTMLSSSPLMQPEGSTDGYQDRVSSPELSPFASDSKKSISEKAYSPPITPTQASMAERIADGVRYVEPSFKEIDDVMKQLNGDDSDLGVERNPMQVWKSSPEVERAGIVTPDRVASPASEQLLKASPARIPTSSPNHLDRPFQYLPEQDYGSSNTEESAFRDAAADMVARNARYSPSFKKSRHSVGSEEEMPIHRLNRKTSGSISNWDDLVSDDEEVNFRQRLGFFDNRVGHVITDAMNDRLQPVESTLAELTIAISRLNNRSRSRRPRRSRSVESDADDEDEEDEKTGAMRAVSPFVKDHRFEKLKSILLTAVDHNKSSKVDLREVLENIAQLKTSFQTQASASRSEETAFGFSAKDLATLSNGIATIQTSLSEHQALHSENMKTAVDDAIKKHAGHLMPANPDQEMATKEKLHIQISVLENMLKKAEGRADEEYGLRRGVEERLAESERELKSTIADAVTQREAAQDRERKVRSLLDQHEESRNHIAMLEEAKTALEDNLSDTQDKNVALEETIAEYRISHDKWHEEINSANEENQKLSQMVVSLRDQLEDGIVAKQALRGKFERVQHEMISATRNIAHDQAAWRHKDEEHKARHELGGARLEAEARTRERLELEIERLEKQEREAMKARTLVEDIRSQNGNLTNMVNELRLKAHKSQEQALTLERQLHDTRERSRLEMQRNADVTKNDIETANQQAQLVRTNLESVMHRLEDQISHLLSDAKGAKDRHQAMLEEASISRDIALREAAEAREAALQEHYRFHERTIHEIQVSHQRAMSELGADHSRAFALAHEDHQRAIDNLVADHKRLLASSEQEKRIAEQEFDGRSTLSNDKILHLQDKVVHLQERLTIANQAAQATAEAARAARNPSSSSPVGRTTDPSLRGFDPQALRLTVETLQDQLGERERQIEHIQQQLDNVDQEAPNKIKERDAEITWLRELLGVRMDDMQDVIVQLSTPHFDRTAIRDAVIRLRANLQMEQQERERQIAGGAKFPSLSDIKASPKSLPLAAAAAWGNWRKGQSALSSLAEMSVPLASSSADQTPSKSSPQSFLSGLLTPPNTNIRQTPRTRGSLSRPNTSSQRPLSGFSTPKRQITAAYSPNLQNNVPEDVPETPALLTHGTYDADAPEGSHHYSLDRYVGEQEDLPSEDNSQQGDNDSLTFITSDTNNTTTNPFGPSIELAG